jgi:hypothetical protein
MFSKNVLVCVIAVCMVAMVIGVSAAMQKMKSNKRAIRVTRSPLYRASGMPHFVGSAYNNSGSASGGFLEALHAQSCVNWHGQEDEEFSSVYLSNRCTCPILVQVITSVEENDERFRFNKTALKVPAWNGHPVSPPNNFVKVPFPVEDTDEEDGDLHIGSVRIQGEGDCHFALPHCISPFRSEDENDNTYAFNVCPAAIKFAYVCEEDEEFFPRFVEVPEWAGTSNDVSNLVNLHCNINDDEDENRVENPFIFGMTLA